MTDERRAPVQGNGGPPDERHPPGTITWAEHVEVWLGYQRRWPSSAAMQGPTTIAERGGFGFHEAEQLLGRPLETWEPR